MTKQDTESVNQGFYDQVYARGNPLIEWLLPYISYDQLAKGKRNIRALRRYVKPRSHDGLDVFDYGCGRGLLLMRMPYRPLRAYGLDISPLATQRLSAMNWGSQRSFSTVDASDLEQGALVGHFDIVSCSHVLEHVPDDKATADQLMACLCPGGYLLLNVPINEVFDDPNHVRAYDREKLLNLLKDFKLEILNVEESDRLSAFLLHHEMNGDCGKLKRSACRLLRAIAAMLPLFVIQNMERILPASYKFQQLILVARKPLD
jgi:2-polyprenyl-3-methyl-5-hydroxy-6-metoxy-1,4-benzoquinol methylase